MFNQCNCIVLNNFMIALLIKCVRLEIPQNIACLHSVTKISSSYRSDLLIFKMVMFKLNVRLRPWGMFPLFCCQSALGLTTTLIFFISSNKLWPFTSDHQNQISLSLDPRWKKLLLYYMCSFCQKRAGHLFMWYHLWSSIAFGLIVCCTTDLVHM